MEPHGDRLLFAIGSYDYLAEKMCARGSYARGEVEVRRFPDGERYQCIASEVSSRDVILLGGTASDADTLELYDLACGLVKHGALSLTIVIPYFGYSTMERATQPGEIVTAKTRARLLSAIPPAYRGNRVFMLDLHTEGIPHYFEGGIHPFHVYATPVITAAAKSLGGEDFVLACTDAGRAKWVESLANDLQVSASFVFKRRLDGETTEVTAVSAQVKDRFVIIYDDMIRTGGSLISAAKAYKDAGASRIAALTTHALLPGDAINRLEDCGLFEWIGCTDSHPRTQALESDLLRTYTISGVLCDAIDYLG